MVYDLQVIELQLILLVDRKRTMKIVIEASRARQLRYDVARAIRKRQAAALRARKAGREFLHLEGRMQIVGIPGKQFIGPLAVETHLDKPGNIREQYKERKARQAGDTLVRQ